MNSDAMYRVLKFGTAAERQNLVRSLPPSPFKDVAIPLMDSEQPGMRVVALGPTAIAYCNGSAPEVGTALAGALHRYAVELFEETPDHRGLLPTTLSGLAQSFVNASNLLGRSEDVVEFTDKYVPFYEGLGETMNLPALKLGRIAALLNLNRFDDAAAALEDPALAGNPATDIELARLRARMRQLLAPITADRSAAATPPGPLGDDSVAQIRGALEHVAPDLPGETRLTDFIAKLAASPRSNPNDPAGFDTLLEVLRMGERFLRRGSTEDSELSIRARIREASAIFVFGRQPPAERIRQSLAELEYCLAWARANGVVEAENDALHAINVCHNRLGNPSAAADALLQLRRNLEAARSSIADVVKRGGAFSAYPQLFGSLCERLFAAGRFAELLEAIEASKGRGVADLLTRRSGGAVADATIYTAVVELPELCRQHDFHYVTYFVDDERTYAVLVTADGETHVPAPAPLSRAAIRGAASPMDPKTAAGLSPLVAWLGQLVEDGAVSRGAHLAISPDDDLANVPFALLPLNGRPLAETLSTSRIHNAWHLRHVLGAAPVRPERHLGVVVPTRQNVARAGWAEMRADLLAPIDFLATAVPGETLEGAIASCDALAKQELSGRVVHFSTHGMFPKARTPFEHSGLILADGSSLPDASAIDFDTVLTPRKVLDGALDLTGSHVSMMACVSGLSREGVGGDALGMEWAMIQAGAASVLSSHWNVSAKLAGTFLRTFYEHWLGRSRPRAEALSATIASMRAARGRAAEPSAWAAFSLTGDWR